MRNSKNRKKPELLLRFSFGLLNLSLALSSMLPSKHPNLFTITKYDSWSSVFEWLLLVSSIVLILDSLLSNYRLHNCKHPLYRIIKKNSKSLFDRLCFYGSRYRHIVLLSIVTCNIGFISLGYYSIKNDPSQGFIYEYPLFYITTSLIFIGILISLVDAIMDNDAHRIMNLKNK